MYYNEETETVLKNREDIVYLIRQIRKRVDQKPDTKEKIDKVISEMG